MKEELQDRSDTCRHRLIYCICSATPIYIQKLIYSKLLQKEGMTYYLPELLPSNNASVTTILKKS